MPRPAVLSAPPPRRAFSAWSHLATGVVVATSPVVPRVRDLLVLRPVFVRSATGRGPSHASGLS
jgi:hypothetical protein